MKSIPGLGEILETINPMFSLLDSQTIFIVVYNLSKPLEILIIISLCDFVILCKMEIFVKRCNFKENVFYFRLQYYLR